MQVETERRETRSKPLQFDTNSVFFTLTLGLSKAEASYLLLQSNQFWLRVPLFIRFVARASEKGFRKSGETFLKPVATEME
jgi:hypothetical protein